MRKISRVLIAVLLCSCSTPSSKTKDGTAPESSSGRYELRLKGDKGVAAITSYHSDSAVEDFEDGQKVRDRQEILDFAVSTELVDKRENQLTVRTKTVFKDGSGSLHDYAFPEPDESIDFVYSSQAEVLKADPFPKASIFYLPPVSLPNRPADIGETWTMDHTWISSNDGLPLHLNMVTIFKDVVKCGAFGHCADLEISGQVDVANAQVQKLIHFDSRIWGRMLFSIDRGDVVWSEVRSQDLFKTKEAETKVLSCMISQMQAPNAPARPKVHCEPDTKMVQTPKL
jgi:hypothetical protein